jgi:hypothetical protein
MGQELEEWQLGIRRFAPVPAVPEGYALVPVKLTDAMESAAMDYVYINGFTRGAGPSAVYAAMLSAAPQPAQQAAQPKRWAYCTETDQPCSTCPTLRIPCEAAQQVQEPRLLHCETCNGSGAVDKEHQGSCWVGECPDCDGKGYTTAQQAQPENPLTRLYLQLTDAMEYDSGKDGLEFSPEEWAEALLRDAKLWRTAQQSPSVLSLPHRVRNHLANRNFYSHKEFCEKLEELLQGQAPSVPDAQPVAWVDSLDEAQPHCVTDLKYCSAAQVDRGDHLKYIPLVRAHNIKDKP